MHLTGHDPSMADRCGDFASKTINAEFVAECCREKWPFGMLKVSVVRGNAQWNLVMH
jgi:hypothetical protein